MRMRIDELAARTGVTSRNIRAYREKGLLPPPELEGRTGFYDEEHVQRLDIIEDLQQRGFSLEAIRHILEAWSAGGDFSHLLTLSQMLNSPFQTEEPEVESVEEMLSRFPEAMRDATLLQRAIRLGLVEPGPSNKLRIPSPSLLEAGILLTESGVPLADVLDLFEKVREDLADVADRFIGIAERFFINPAADNQHGARTPKEAITAMERLRPLALEAIRPILVRELIASVERAARRLAETMEPGTRQPTGQKTDRTA